MLVLTISHLSLSPPCTRFATSAERSAYYRSALYRPPPIAHSGRSIESRDNKRIQNNERITRVIEEAKRILYDSLIVPCPKCPVCPKIKNLTFASEKERQIRTAAAFYECFLGVEYERMLRATVDHILAEPSNTTRWELLPYRMQYFQECSAGNGKPCDSCIECYESDKDLKVLDVIAEKRTLIFDMRCGFDELDAYLADRRRGLAELVKICGLDELEEMDKLEEMSLD